MRDIALSEALSEWEINAREIIDKHEVYSEFLQLTMDWIELANEAIPLCSVQQRTKLSAVLGSKLLLTACHDLRGLQILIGFGYVEQALALAASAYEHVLLVIKLTGDEQSAEFWRQWNKPSQSAFAASALTEDALMKVGASKDNIEATFKIYTQFCQSKHANPISELKYGLVVDDQVVGFRFGPHSDSIAIAKGVLILNAITMLFGLACRLFIETNLDEHFSKPLLETNDIFQAKRRALDLEGAKIWPGSTVDPYPTKWRKF